MQQQQSQAHNLPARTTPGRRRGPNKHFANSPARKTYASENDMPASTDYAFTLDLVSPLPLTPQRQPRNSPGPTSQSTHPRSKPRTANKQKQKQASTSPEDTKYGRTTPPQSVTMPKSAAAAAFAGATFHASPAPSSLPIPSFLAKALDSPGIKDTRENQEPSPPPTDTEAPTPQHRVLTTEPARQESPLDIFFRADRAEKERARRASSANIFSTIPRPFSPPRPTQSPQEARTLPNGAGSLRARRPAGPQRTTSSGISSVELDGTPGKPMGPSFSTPYQERIRAARSAAAGLKRNSQPLIQEKTPPTSPPDQDLVSQELSDKLKRFLAIPTEPKDGNIQQTRPVAASTTTAITKTTIASGTFASPPHGVQPTYGRHMNGQALPTLENQEGPARGVNVLDMENTLRRMLKIDAGISLGGAAASPTSYQSS
ncbi:hypothetical protein V8F20_008734 [Naviculisporaceae sp. PSN 640]